MFVSTSIRYPLFYPALSCPQERVVAAVEKRSVSTDEPGGVCQPEGLRTKNM